MITELINRFKAWAWQEVPVTKVKSSEGYSSEQLMTMSLTKYKAWLSEYFIDHNVRTGNSVACLQINDVNAHSDGRWYVAHTSPVCLADNLEHAFQEAKHTHLQLEEELGILSYGN